MKRTRRLRFTQGGMIFMERGDDCRWIVDAMLAINYAEEFCAALDFSPEFLADLMAAGFLVMSSPLVQSSPSAGEEDREGEAGAGGKKAESASGGGSAKPPQYVVLPKLHLERSLLFWENLRETKSAKKLFPRYELRFDSDFEVILERCAAVHGEDWLTPPLREGIRRVRALDHPLVRPASFGLYRNGVLAAGEFGVCAGRVYTSYSGYREENSAGTVQMLLTAHWLRERGFAFWDLGMPLEYKDRLGACNVLPGEFVKRWRGGKLKPR